MLQKVTDLIVKRRNWILVLFLVLTGACAFLSTKVKLNYDMMEYLPSDSETRVGLDLMTDEFGEEVESQLQVTVADLATEDKWTVRDKLTEVENVAEVAYDETDEYNRENYTRYVLTVEAEADSEQARGVYKAVQDLLKEAPEIAERETALGGAIDEQNRDVLPVWILALAVGCALVILIIMSESYVEPFLFMVTILLAVVLNKGTNIIFPSVSHVTDSITAILQLALSMDYSIMLMERFRQEKQHEADKVRAMQKALRGAFTAISSSSVTTIVGLLALVFMSFTIGRDMGLVLAKGVLFSLVAIFTCLPGLILLFDKAITKTHKKCPNLKLNLLGEAAYKGRFVAAGLFAIVFVVSFLLKGNLGITYTEPNQNEIDEVFSEDNLMVIMYQNEDEARAAEHCRMVAEWAGTDEVLCYGNTIGERLTAENLRIRLADLAAETEISDEVMRVIYYHYYNHGETGKMTATELVDFIENKVYGSEEFSEEVDAEMRVDITRLSNFVRPNEFQRARSGMELADLLEIDVGKVDDLLVYYNTRNLQTRLTLGEFVEFANNYVLKNEHYAGNFSTTQREKLATVARFTNRNELLMRKTAAENAQLIGIDVVTVEQLYEYRKLLGVQEKVVTGEMRMTLAEFVRMVQMLAQSPEYATQMSPEVLRAVQELSALVDPLDTTRYDYRELYAYLQQVGMMLGQVLPVSEELLQNVYIIYGMQQAPEVWMTPVELVDFVLAHQNDERLAEQISDTVLAELVTLQNVMASVVNGRSYAPAEMAEFLGTDNENMKLLYSLYEVKWQGKDIWMSVQEFVQFLTGDVMRNVKYQNEISAEQQRKLTTIESLMDGVLKNRAYMATEMTKILQTLAGEVEQNLIELLYMYHGSIYHYIDTWTLTVEELVNYLHGTVLMDARFDDFIDTEMREQVARAKQKVADAKKLLVGEKFSRVVINSKMAVESEETFDFIERLKTEFDDGMGEHYLVGNSAMAYEMAHNFPVEMDMITVITMIFIFVVVSVTFRSMIAPLILVLLIQCAVYLTMGMMSVGGGSLYFIALLIVQSILMGATIDYAVLYTSYYLEMRQKMNVKESIIEAYNRSIQAIATSGLILIIVTLIVGSFTTAVVSKITVAISQGTTCAVVLILLLLPAMLGAWDRVIVKKK